MSHNAKYKLTNEESEMVERYNYIFQSNQALVSILAREFASTQNPTVKSMLQDYCDECKKAYLELCVAHDAVLDKYLEVSRSDNEVHFSFDFINQEVHCKW